MISQPENMACRLTRCDLHCHTNASSAPVIAALGFIDAPESYSEPEKVYDQARARGMDLVAMTDHDTIDGAMSLRDRGFENLIVGCEETVYFPEDRCKLHVLVWGLTPEQHGVLQGARHDVYEFANHLYEYNLPHSLAHPLYDQNKRMSRWHLERCSLLFKGFEVLNGAHAGSHRTAVEGFLKSLTPGRVHRLVTDHSLEPLWPRIWDKAQTAGSDDHALLNVGRTWTGVPRGPDGAAVEPSEFLRHVMAGRGEVGGVAGHSSLLAHQVTSVAAQYVARRIVPNLRPRAQYVASKMLRFAGVDVKGPSVVRLAIDSVHRLVHRRTRRSSPLLNALRHTLPDVLSRYPDIKAKLDPGTWTDGSAMSLHERFAGFFDDLHDALQATVAPRLIDAIKDRDVRAARDHALALLMLEAAQIPYLFSLFHQNKDNVLVDHISDHSNAVRAPGRGPAGRPLRVCLLTDTLGDVNGVSRFIQNVAEEAYKTGRDLRVLTSTRFAVPKLPNIYNFDPVFAWKMPKYEHLDTVLPPIVRMLREIDRQRPDVIHISTPGPVGMVGFLAAKMMRVPIVGVYHTDFPAYVDHLFDDEAFTWVTKRFMSYFYAPFSNVFTRSDDYTASLEALGIARSHMHTLKAGIDTAAFNPAFRDTSIWAKHGLPEKAVKVLYVGRVSIEKNLPLLTSVWTRARARLLAQGVDARLVVVGDGPYRAQMQRELPDATFLGFRHGAELSTIYASSDMFVFPSVTDTLGQVVMESQASGLPVLVSDQGGPKEVVDHGRTGMVLSATSAEAWVNAIVNIAGDESKRRAMGEAAFASMSESTISRSFEHFWAVHEACRRPDVAVQAQPEAPADGVLSDEAGSFNAAGSPAGRVDRRASDTGRATNG
jgi:glycosyltransferase involved in cell wall biosynthesis